MSWERDIMSWERDNHVVGTRSYVVGTRSYLVGRIIMLWERDLMSWERDKYFFHMSPQCCRTFLCNLGSRYRIGIFFWVANISYIFWGA